MKYSFFSKTRWRRLVGGVFAFIFFSSFVASNLLIINQASAQEGDAEFIDKTTIIIGSDIYRDSNPFDDNNEWTGASQGPGRPEGRADQTIDCASKITFPNNEIKSDEMKGQLDKPKLASGECRYGQDVKAIRVKKASQSQVTAYKISDRSIFMPVCWASPDLDKSIIGIASFVRLNYKTKFDCTFTRVPDDMSFKNDNIYTMGIFNVAGDQGGTWVDTSNMRQYTMACETATAFDIDVPINIGFLRNGNVCVKLGDGSFTLHILVDNDPGTVVLANNGEITQPDPRANYKIGANEEETEDPANDTASPTCESENGTIIIGWIICAIINTLDNAVDKSTELVNDLLDFDTNNLKTGDSAVQLRAAWGVFRVISSFALVAVVLVMVIGQAMGGGN